MVDLTNAGPLISKLQKQSLSCISYSKAFTLLRIVDDELSHAERKWSQGLRGVTSLLDTKLIFK